MTVKIAHVQVYTSNTYKEAILVHILEIEDYTFILSDGSCIASHKGYPILPSYKYVNDERVIMKLND